MKLSLWIIAGKLSRYEPEISIKSGNCDVDGVRLYSEALAGSNGNLLFVATASVYYKDAHMDKNVLCVHRGDWIRLNTTDVDAVFNDILEIFDRFYAWTYTLYSAAHAFSSMQHFIDISNDFLPYPILIFDNQVNVVAYSKTFGVGVVDEYWDTILLKGETHQDIFKGYVRNANNEVVIDWNDKAAIYDSKCHKIIGAHLIIDGEIVGSVVIVEFGTAFNAAQCQLADVFCESVTNALGRGSSETELRTGSAMITDLLEGRKIENAYVDGLLNKIIGDSSAKALMLCKNMMRSDFNFMNSFATRLSQRSVPCFTMVYRGYIIGVLKHGDETELMKKLKEDHLDDEKVFSFSLPFTSAALLPGAFQQAKLALDRGSKESGSVNKCVDYAYAYLLDMLSTDINMTGDLLHPALGILSRYDAVHKSELYNTLFIFLSNERNVVATAKCLFIHRNSLLYRLQRIERLITADLEDVNVRMYLLLSYHLETQKQPRRSAPEENIKEHTDDR